MHTSLTPETGTDRRTTPICLLVVLAGSTALLSGAFHLDERADILHAPTGPIDLSHIAAVVALPRRVHLAGGTFEGDVPWASRSSWPQRWSAVESRCGSTFGPTRHEVDTATAQVGASQRWLVVSPAAARRSESKASADADLVELTSQVRPRLIPCFTDLSTDANDEPTSVPRKPTSS